MNFFRISRQIPEKSDAFCFFNQICENKLESLRKFWNLWELLTIIQNYSLVSLTVTRRLPQPTRRYAWILLRVVGNSRTSMINLRVEENTRRNLLK